LFQMRKISLAYLLLSLAAFVSGQQGTDMQRQFEELKTRIKTLEIENQVIRAEQRAADSISYSNIRLEIFEAYSNISQLGFDFRNTIDKIAVTGLFTRLMQANNPASDVLGFRFTDVVMSAADKHFMHQLKKETDRKRFSQAIGNIISNPVVSTLAHSNPISSVVSSLITVIVGFTTSSVNANKDNNRARDLSVEQSTPFNEKEIAAFRKELEIYINFYDELISISDHYLKGIENLNDKYAFLVQSVTSYKAELYTQTESQENNPLISLTLSLPEPDRAGVDFGSMLNDPSVRQTLQAARKFPLLKQSVEYFKTEYYSLLFHFLTSYSQTLEKAKTFPGHSVDSSKIDALSREIESFITAQKKAG